MKVPAFASIFLFLAVAAFSQSPRTFREHRVVDDLRKLDGAQSTFAATGNGRYGTLAELANSGLIDPALGSGNKYGYVFVIEPFFSGATPQYSVTATPARYRKTGVNSYFYSHESGFRGGDNRGLAAGSADPILDIDICSTGSAADNERCSQLRLQTLASAQQIYATTIGAGNFASLSELRSSGLIDGRLAAGTLAGYQYDVSISGQNGFPQFTITAAPTECGATGSLVFSMTQTGLITSIGCQ